MSTANGNTEHVRGMQIGKLSANDRNKSKNGSLLTVARHPNKECALIRTMKNYIVLNIRFVPNFKCFFYFFSSTLWHMVVPGSVLVMTWTA